jgi:hypothetical protein
MSAQTYYLVIPTVNAKTVVSGTLDAFNRYLKTEFTSAEDLANAVQTSIDHQQAFYIDEYAIGLVTVSKEPVASEHQLTVIDLIAEML